MVPSKDEDISIRIRCKMSDRKEVGCSFKVTLTPGPNLCLMVVTFSFNCDADWRIAEPLSTLHGPISTVFDQTNICDKIRCVSNAQNVYQAIWLPLVGDLGNVT